MTYKARIDSITKVDNRIDIGGVFLKDAEEFPMPTISLPADAGTKEQAIELIKEEIRKFKVGYEVAAILQKFIGTEISL